MWDFRLQVVLGKITRVHRPKHSHLIINTAFFEMAWEGYVSVFILDCHHEPVWPWAPGITQVSEFLSRTSFIELA